MNVKITSKELETTEAIKDYIEKKVERLKKYFGEMSKLQKSVSKLEHLILELLQHIEIYMLL